MARPQRNTVDYFPFYCEDGNKMFYLEETYGNDGFAVFVKLLRELARTDYHYLDLSKNTTVMFLSAKCKVSKEVLLSIVNDLVELEKFDSELWKEAQIIWCESFIESIQDAYRKRANNCIDKNELIQLLTSKGILKHSKGRNKPPKGDSKGDVKPQIKEKKIKEKEIKEVLMSEIEISDVEEKNLPYLEVAKSFYELFRSNLLEAGVSTVTLEKSKAKSYLDTFRLMEEKGEADRKQLKEVYRFLQTSEFWKTNILSPKKLREQFQKLLMQSKINQNGITKTEQLGNRAERELQQFNEGRKQAFDKGFNFDELK